MAIISKTIVIIVVLILDIIWLTINKKTYNYQVTRVQNSKIQLNLVGALASYLCVIAILLFYVLPYAHSKVNNQNNLKTSLIYGGIPGLLIYGIYNFTNLAIFKNYDWQIGLLDTMWGFTLFTIATYLYLKLKA